MTRNADKLVLKEIHGGSGREAVLKALDNEVKRTLKENRKQMELEGDYALGEDFEERNGRREEGLCYGMLETSGLNVV